MEKTFVMLKPDAIQRELVGEIISRFEKKGLKLVASKLVLMDDAILEKHYAQYVGKPFFRNLKRFMSSAPCLAMVWEGVEAVKVVRALCGATNGREAAPGTIRGDFSLSVQSNLVHAADSKETAEQEIARFFKPDELLSYEKLDYAVLYAEDERK